MTAGASLRERVTNLLGPGTLEPGLSGPAVLGQADHQADHQGWVLEDLRFETPEGEAVPAHFLRPPDGAGPVPAVIYAHAHGSRYDFSRAELTEGRPSLQGPYAPDLVRLGIAALCIEMPCFGTRQEPAEQARAKALLWQGSTLFGQMLAEQRSGVDFLAGHPQVEARRIGALGFSMGSTLSWWLAALDPRIRAAAALCSFADLATLVQSGAHDGHGIYMTVPGLLEVARSGEIAGLAAPRALMIAAGLQDWSTPEDALTLGLADLSTAYADAPERLVTHISPHHGHEETPEMRADVLKFLKTQLCGAAQADPASK